MKNNQQELSIIKTFLESVSWADECEILTTNEELLHQPSVTVLQTPCSVYFPCHWTEFDYWKNQCWKYYNWPFQSQPILLIYGNPPLQEAEKMWREAMTIEGYAATKYVSLILDFIDVEVEIYLRELFAQATDGVDWGKTIVKWLEGGKGFVMDWD
ncbi:hypothetical protein [Crocosphaera sp. Alani8]|uniref:hypothetical protein n=1 Tax=Crocosphaera sp. Alani8 TaxID=3038952 RepID=UPI00313E4FF1